MMAAPGDSPVIQHAFVGIRRGASCVHRAVAARARREGSLYDGLRYSSGYSEVATNVIITCPGHMCGPRAARYTFRALSPRANHPPALDNIIPCKTARDHSRVRFEYTGVTAQRIWRFCRHWGCE